MSWAYFGNPKCSFDPCPVNCVWGGWSYVPCPVTCGPGIITKYRSIDTVANWGGTICTGPDVIIENCSTSPCPIDCGWNHWGDWSACSVTCANGTQTRTRATIPAQYGGKECLGTTKQSHQCHTEPCPINCEWSVWNSTHCSVSCGGGKLTKSRSIVRMPDWGGAFCTGPTIQVEDCNQQTCPKVYAEKWFFCILAALIGFVLLSLILAAKVIHQRRTLKGYEAP